MAHFLFQMTESFKTIYKNNVVVEIIMITPQDKLLVRKVRSLKADDTVSNTDVLFIFADNYVLFKRISLILRLRQYTRTMLLLRY